MLPGDIAPRIAVDADHAHFPGDLERGLAAFALSKPLTDQTAHDLGLRRVLFSAQGTQARFEFRVRRITKGMAASRMIVPANTWANTRLTHQGVTGSSLPGHRRPGSAAQVHA